MSIRYDNENFVSLFDLIHNLGEICIDTIPGSNELLHIVSMTYNNLHLQYVTIFECMQRSDELDLELRQFLYRYATGEPSRLWNPYEVKAMEHDRILRQICDESHDNLTRFIESGGEIDIQSWLRRKPFLAKSLYDDNYIIFYYV